MQLLEAALDSRNGHVVFRVPSLSLSLSFSFIVHCLYSYEYNASSTDFRTLICVRVQVLSFVDRTLEWRVLRAELQRSQLQYAARQLLLLRLSNAAEQRDRFAIVQDFEGLLSASDLQYFLVFVSITETKCSLGFLRAVYIDYSQRPFRL